MCANDLLQGPFLADYASKEAKFKSVVTVNDTKSYGKGLAETFEQAVRSRRGHDPRPETMPELTATSAPS